MRPSGVVSHGLLLRQQPCTITTGTFCSPFIGIWYCTYIWLTVTSPPFRLLVSPPTKKLPCSLTVSGPGFFACAATDVHSATIARDLTKIFMGRSIVCRHAPHRE